MSWALSKSFAKANGSCAFLNALCNSRSIANRLGSFLRLSEYISLTLKSRGLDTPCSLNNDATFWVYLACTNLLLSLVKLNIISSASGAKSKPLLFFSPIILIIFWRFTSLFKEAKRLCFNPLNSKLNLPCSKSRNPCAE